MRLSIFPSLFIMPLAALLTLTISACQPATSDSSSSSAAWGCQAQQAPFAYSVCSVKADVLMEGSYALKLFWSDDNKQPLLTFEKVLTTLPAQQSLAFAMNAGMYNARYAPIGYTVIEGQQLRALNLNKGGGNFHLLPNGVMWWDKAGQVQITESHALQQQLDDGSATPWYATQSGPMLVINNEIHPQFNVDGTSLKLRNGAGVCSDGRIKLVNSEQPVSFYQFAALFKEELGCPNALFLDGGIASALYAPTIDKQDKKQMGVILALIATE